MGEGLERGTSEMVLCGACSDVVGAGARCPTCGGAPVAAPGSSGPGAALDEALLDRVNIALAAQAALARRTATQRVGADRSRQRGEAWSMTARLPRDSSCPGVARRLLEEYAWEELDEREGENAMLIASELATNAFVHGNGVIWGVIDGTGCVWADLAVGGDDLHSAHPFDRRPA